MEIGSDVLRSQLSFNLNHNQLVDQRIDQLVLRRERNDRLDLYRDSLALKSSTKELQNLVEKGLLQESDTGTATATSSSSQGLDTSSGEDLDKAIDQVTELSGISSGNIIINGTKVSIDITTDSINDVISNINSSVSGVTASYDDTENKFVLTSSEDMSVGNGTSGLFAALGVDTGQISNGASEGQVDFFSTNKFKGALKKFVYTMNKVLGNAEALKKGLPGNGSEDDATNDAEGFISKIKEAVSSAYTNTINEDFGDVGKARLDFGMTFSFADGDFAAFDSRKYKSNLENEVDVMTEFFATEMDPDDENTGGLFDQLLATLTDYNITIEEKIGTVPKTGLLVNFQA
jgi:hypothetical protein